MKIRESETLELKKSTSEHKEAIIAISAILNKHQTGELYFGIKDTGEIVGQDISDKTLRDVSRLISENIEPKIFPNVTAKKLAGKTCVYIKFAGSAIPYFAYNRAYIRVGSTDRQLSARELENMILAKNKDKLRWDTGICSEANVRDISSRKLKSFLKIAGLKYDTLKSSLNKLKLMIDGKVLNTAIILFGRKPTTFFSNAKLRCAVFATTDTSYPLDMKDFDGDLFYLIERAEEYILEHIHIGMRLEGLRRIDLPEIDKEAVREAIINAFCHRNYFEPDSVNIAIFKNRLEIRSPGLLYGNLTIAQIKTEMISERRNELISELFHRVHFIEKWGRGIRLIMSKEPGTKFKEVGTHFITVFKRKHSDGNEVVSVPGKDTVKDTVRDTVKVPEKVTVKVPEKVTVNQRKILVIIRRNRHVTIAELAIIVKMSDRKIKENLSKLKEKKLIRRIGPDKGGYWEIVKPG
ncbi:MAG: RNA-binding domain-containing protein [Elusimicrobiota bacterium]